MGAAHCVTWSTSSSASSRAGGAADEFTVTAPDAAARAVLSATARFHGPRHAAVQADPEIDDTRDGLGASTRRPSERHRPAAKGCARGSRSVTR